MNSLERDLRLGEVFTPAAPIDRLRLFAGREQQRRLSLMRFCNAGATRSCLASAVWARHRCPAFCGSFSNRGAVRNRPTCCDDSDDYTAIWRKAFDDLRFIEQRRGVGFAPEVQEVVRSASELVARDEPITPHAVRLLLESLVHRRSSSSSLMSLRVADRLGTDGRHDRPTSVPATLVLVGVGESVSSLIAEHESVERALAQG